ncbi:unnamed protein product [Pieris macdunnoughi]|uniref:Uncharacterized protein n=1 Tax=Pieris macdunnoughi TaxID=345717 RepID=A0A821X4M0_9NEOP|nr:unnamed protein product [Pieris macdunnoughi]
MTMKSLKYSERDDMMDGFSPVPPPLPRRQPVRNIYAEPFVDPSEMITTPATPQRAQSNKLPEAKKTLHIDYNMRKPHNSL